MISRRELGIAVLALCGLAGLRHFGFAAKAAAGGTFEVNLTPEEWKKRLTPEQYYILREQGTERAFTSPLLDEHREGVFACVGCDLPLFSSKTKFDSGTGWPSFWAPIKGNVEQSRDASLGILRQD